VFVGAGERDEGEEGEGVRFMIWEGGDGVE
jgi:hypothetical protein